MTSPRAAPRPIASLQDGIPAGLRLRPFQVFSDDRGDFFESYRRDLDSGVDTVQWNVAHSAAGVLRGVHVHIRHTDYLVLVTGKMLLGLHDIRAEHAQPADIHLLEIEASTPLGISIPPGLCHAFYFPVASTFICGVSEYWNADDDLACRFDCQELGFEWPNAAPILSHRDATAGGYRQMRKAFDAQRAPLQAVPGS